MCGRGGQRRRRGNHVFVAAVQVVGVAAAAVNAVVVAVGLLDVVVVTKDNMVKDSLDTLNLGVG